MKPIDEDRRADSPALSLCGSPKTVREQLAHNAKDWGFDTHMGAFHFGTLPHELTVKSLRFFAEEVMPHVRDINEPTVSRIEATHHPQ